jgi:3-hydroxyisobutyrate dehydrogenase-like beta-hydroxyacid dehydrogenase
MRRGAIFVDAPVSGGPAGAEKGTLTFMMGLDATHPHLERIKVILGMMGKNLFECGGPTLGLATKICNNYISGTIAIATSEGYNLAIRLGLNPMTFQKVLAVSTGGSWVNSNCNVSGTSVNTTSSWDIDIPQMLTGGLARSGSGSKSTGLK